jgi:hypothetical protein
MGSAGVQQVNPNHVYPENTRPELKDAYVGFACIAAVGDPGVVANTAAAGGGTIDDADWTYCNGVKIGEMTLESNPRSYQTKRDYAIPADAVRCGQDNTIVIRVFDRWGDGGVVGPLAIVAEDPDSRDAWSPYIDTLDLYDGDASITGKGALFIHRFADYRRLWRHVCRCAAITRGLRTLFLPHAKARRRLFYPQIRRLPQNYGGISCRCAAITPPALGYFLLAQGATKALLSTDSAVTADYGGMSCAARQFTRRL